MKRLSLEELDAWSERSECGAFMYKGEELRRLILMARESVLFREGLLKIGGCRRYKCNRCVDCSVAGYEAETAADALWNEEG